VGYYDSMNMDEKIYGMYIDNDWVPAIGNVCEGPLPTFTSILTAWLLIMGMHETLRIIHGK